MEGNEFRKTALHQCARQHKTSARVRVAIRGLGFGDGGSVNEGGRGADRGGRQGIDFRVWRGRGAYHVYETSTRVRFADLGFEFQSTREAGALNVEGNEC